MSAQEMNNIRISDQNLRYLAEKIQDKSRTVEEDLAGGACGSYDQYQFACGIYKGLHLAIGYIIELNERLEKDDDF